MSCATCDSIKHNKTYDLVQRGFRDIPESLKTFVGWENVRYEPEDEQDDMLETFPLSCPACGKSFSATVAKFMDLDFGRPRSWELTMKRMNHRNNSRL